MDNFYGNSPSAPLNDGKEEKANSTNTNSTAHSFFNNATLIYAYTRADAINDGMLFPVPVHVQKQAKFKFPITLTRKVLDLYVAWELDDSKTPSLPKSRYQAIKSAQSIAPCNCNQSTV